ASSSAATSVSGSIPFSRSISRTASTISCVIRYLPFVDQVGPHDLVVRYVGRLGALALEPERAFAGSDDLAAHAPTRGLQLHLPAESALEVLARAERALGTRRGDLDRVAVEVRTQHRGHPLAERVVDAPGVVDVDAEALLPRQLEGQHLDTGERLRNRAGNLAVQLSLLVVRTGRHHKKWAPRAHFKTAEMWSGKNSRVALDRVSRRLLEHDRDRAVVHELDLHPGAEDARLDGHAGVAEGGAEALEERLRVLRPRGAAEARPVALRGVRDQGELGHDERRPARVQQRPVEPAVGAFEDAQPRHPAGEAVDVRIGVLRRHPDEREQTGPDRPAGPHARAGDALDDDPQRPRLLRLADARGVAARARLHEARELVVAVRLGGAALLVEGARERVVGVVVGRRHVDHRPELRLRLLPAAKPEVRDPERLPDRRLLRLEPLR